MHFDQLDRLEVIAKPESVCVNVEFLNPSFLVKRGDSGFRLVTAFKEVGNCCKPKPTILPIVVDSIFRTIAHWNYIIKTDLNPLRTFGHMAKAYQKLCKCVDKTFDFFLLKGTKFNF